MKDSYVILINDKYLGFYYKPYSITEINFYEINFYTTEYIKEACIFTDKEQLLKFFKNRFNELKNKFHTTPILGAITVIKYE